MTAMSTSSYKPKDDSSGDVPMTVPYRMPDLFTAWPWKTTRNPLYLEAKADSDEWLATFGDFFQKYKDCILDCDGTLFCAYGLPSTDKERLRCAGDVNTLLFVVDDILDYEDDATVKERMRILMDAMENPSKPRPDGEWIVGEMTRQFWERTIKVSNTLSQERFMEGVRDCMAGMVRESLSRKVSRQHDSVQGFLKTRRDSAGCNLVFALSELEVAVPAEAMKHPQIQELVAIIQDISCIANDTFSYRREQSRGRTEDNIITVVMNNLGTDVAGAIDWVENHHKMLMEQFIEKHDKVPKWGEPTDSQVKNYIESLAGWVWANARWSFECRRYMGDEGLEIMEESRWVRAIPKERV